MIPKVLALMLLMISLTAGANDMCTDQTRDGHPSVAKAFECYSDTDCSLHQYCNYTAGGSKCVNVIDCRERSGSCLSDGDCCSRHCTGGWCD
ncbi:MAG: hypothetical protein EOP06_04060 [Proteobacteria bacterium]|nr:MAG: hypothetical protein EOP06_04060 [Pseudomonadota bacterium]